MHQSFLTYKNFKFFKISIFIVVLSLLIYVYHEPIAHPNGGTWVGYGFGGLATAMIVFLMWFGIRKRQYSSSLGTVQGWLSAHVYLGGALIVIATLHTGFQFNFNIHTLAYALMMVVILSGFYGVYVYVRFPRLMGINQSQKTREMMFEALDDVEINLLKKAKNLNETSHLIVLELINQSIVGGKVSKQIKMVDQFIQIRQSKKIIDLIQAKLMKTLTNDGASVKEVSDLLQLLTKHNKLLLQINSDVTYKSILEFWLYLHVPVSFALLAALTAHIVVVFFYW